MRVRAGLRYVIFVVSTVYADKTALIRYFVEQNRGVARENGKCNSYTTAIQLYHQSAHDTTCIINRNNIDRQLKLFSSKIPTSDTHVRVSARKKTRNKRSVSKSCTTIVFDRVVRLKRQQFNYSDENLTLN